VEGSLGVTSHLPLVAVAPLVGCVLALSACSPAPTNPTTTAASASAPPSATATQSATPTPTATTTSIPAEPQTGAAAAAAFKTWVKQYNAEQWDRHYATLVAAQRKIITEKRYTTCRDKSINPTFKWVKTVKTKANVKSKIPGTSKTQPATLVTARLRVQGFTLPITAHMFYEDGAWHWSMTKENIQGCKK
jgi:hypothetical protein